MRLTLATVGPAGAMEDADVSYLLELERLTREVWDHLTAMFVVEEVAEVAQGNGSCDRETGVSLECSLHPPDLFAEVTGVKKFSVRLERISSRQRAADWQFVGISSSVLRGQHVPVPSAATRPVRDQ
jgi:hypothetical protein